MIVYNLEQDSTEWLAWRSTGLGASDTATVLGVNPWRTREDLFLEKTGQADGPVFNAHMRRGKLLEPTARRKYETLYGWPMEPACVSHSEHLWFKASLDGLRADHRLITEIKAPALKSYTKMLDNGCPDYYQMQIQHQLLITGAPLCHFVAYNEEVPASQRLLVVPIRADRELQEYLFEELQTFWDEICEYKNQNKN